MNREPSAFLLFIAILMVSACQQAQQKQDVKYLPALQVDTVHFERSSASCIQDSSDCARMLAVYPQVQLADPMVSRRINDTILHHVKLMTSFTESEREAAAADMDLLAQRFLGDYEQYAQESSYQMPWFIETRSYVRHHSRRFICVELQGYSYTGGAHPNAMTTFLNFDRQTGALVHLDDIVADRKAFNLLAERKFRAARELDDSIDLQEAGFFWEGGFQPPANFGFEKDGILLYYNPYEIAPYAAGPTTFSIRYSELETVVDTILD